MAEPSRNTCPDWARSVGAMIAADAKCRVQCSTCFGCKAVDLGAIAKARGRNFSLWGKRSHCRLSPGCRGTVRFYIVGIADTRPMWDC